jgi:hypothetical protein
VCIDVILGFVSTTTTAAIAAVAAVAAVALAFSFYGDWLCVCVRPVLLDNVDDLVPFSSEEEETIA